MAATIDNERSVRERVRAWAKPPRELVMTTSGKFLCLFTLGIGFGAVNTGNNLLFLLLGMLLALILASGVLSEAVIMRVSARRRLPQRIVAGVGAAGAYRLSNAKNYASLSLEVGDRNAKSVAGPGTGRVIGPPSISWWKVWKGTPTEQPVSNTYTLRIDGAQETDLDARFTFGVRGRYQLETLRITTRFPFGLFEKSRTIEEPAEVTVFPAGIDAGDWVATVWGRFGEVPMNRRGDGEEFFGLRDYRVGEDRRRIHWKTTARRGAAVMRETEALTHREVEVVFADWSPTVVSPAAFERGVSKTVGLLTALTQMGWRVGLRTRDLVLEPTIGANHLDAMLGALAVVTPHRDAWAIDEVPGLARITVGASATVAGIASDIALPFEDVAHA